MFPNKLKIYVIYFIFKHFLQHIDSKNSNLQFRVRNDILSFTNSIKEHLSNLMIFLSNLDLSSR